MSVVRYSSKTMRRAQQLAAEEGLGPKRIARRLQEEGLETCPCPTTVRTWIDPDYRARRRGTVLARERARWARKNGGRLGRHDHSPEFKLARIWSLKDAGLTPNAIANVMTFDFPHTPVSRGQVKALLTDGTIPPHYRPGLCEEPTP